MSCETLGCGRWDVSFKEDNWRGTQGHSRENLAVISHIGVNLLSQEKTAKVGIENKRLVRGLG